MLFKTMRYSKKFGITVLFIALLIVIGCFTAMTGCNSKQIFSDERINIRFIGGEKQETLSPELISESGEPKRTPDAGYTYYVAQLVLMDIKNGVIPICMKNTVVGLFVSDLFDDNGNSYPNLNFIPNPKLDINGTDIRVLEDNSLIFIFIIPQNAKPIMLEYEYSYVESLDQQPEDVQYYSIKIPLDH